MQTLIIKMANFSYTAVNSAGKHVSGTIVADSRDEAVKNLREQGSHPLAVDEAGKTIVYYEERAGDGSMVEKAVRARALIGADGANSAVRDAAGISVQRRDYGQQAIVATVRGARGHAGTAWQRFLATGPLALLPLASGDAATAKARPATNASNS